LFQISRVYLALVLNVLIAADMTVIGASWEQDGIKSIPLSVIQGSLCCVGALCRTLS